MSDDDVNRIDCPRCDRPIRAVSSTGPGTHRAHPCGHLVSVAFARWASSKSDDETDTP
ncbi:hypothetical protein [Halorussus halophilus]|uniref:hypothetical protein n=1 Tax=Halorussus halophilus TaxID=2650975 RepID=UPI001787C3CE|nr:hypothetical protein [Halorussus halophilus]